jgi:hypothetical protein
VQIHTLTVDANASTVAAGEPLESDRISEIKENADYKRFERWLCGKGGPGLGALPVPAGPHPRKMHLWWGGRDEVEKTASAVFAKDVGGVLRVAFSKSADPLADNRFLKDFASTCIPETLRQKVLDWLKPARPLVISVELRELSSCDASEVQEVRRLRDCLAVVVFEWMQMWPPPTP